MTPDPMQPTNQGQPMPPMPQPVKQPLDVTAAMLACATAIETLAAKAKGTGSAAEARDFMQGAMFGAQILVQLDPSRLAGGDTPAGRAASVPNRPPPQPPTHDGNRNGIIGA